MLSSKKIYYSIMIRNGFHMPSITSSICQLDWMDKVRNGIHWIPKDHELKIKNCAAAPKKDLILREIDKLLKTKKYKSIGWDEDLTPNKKWCLEVLSTLDSAHPYFEKSYMPAAAKRRAKIVDKAGFFEDIPFQAPHKKNYRSALRVPKGDKLKEKIKN